MKCGKCKREATYVTVQKPPRAYCYLHVPKGKTTIKVVPDRAQQVLFRDMYAGS